MNIILATDDNFAQFCATVIYSILRYDKSVNFYILTEGLTSKSSDLIRDVVNKYDNTSEVEIKKVDESVTCQFPMPKGDGIKHISIATYFRLFSTELLPNVDKAIYLDCDIFVRGSWKDLWNTDINDYYIGAVYHPDLLSINNGAFKRLNIPVSQGYFNAGVLLMNLKKWRNENLYSKFLDFIKNNYANIVNHDQDVLNAVCGGQTLSLPCKWNMTNIYYYQKSMYRTDKRIGEHAVQIEREGLENSSVIVHFAFRPKPWEFYSLHPFANEFRSCLKYVGKYNYYKNIRIKDLYNYFIKPQLMGYGRYKRLD